MRPPVLAEQAKHAGRQGKNGPLTEVNILISSVFETFRQTTLDETVYWAMVGRKPQNCDGRQPIIYFRNEQLTHATLRLPWDRWSAYRPIPL